MVTAKLICVFVFAYAKHWFSHDTAHICSFSESLFCLGEEELGKLQDTENPEAKVCAIISPL